MLSADPLASLRASDAALAAACLALAPAALGGVRVRTDRGAACERWLALLHELLPEGTPVRRMPVHIDEERLYGGWDLARTLSAGRPAFTRGLLAEADGGVIVLSLAERLEPRLAAALALVLERRTVSGPPGGARGGDEPARFALVALDGGQDAYERCPDVLGERLGLQIDLNGLEGEWLTGEGYRRAAMASARARFAAIAAAPEALEVLCASALACGIDSLRAPWLALQVARASAALAQRSRIDVEDLEAAARLVLAARARIAPESASGSSVPSEAPPSQPGATPEAVQTDPSSGAADTAGDVEPLTDRVLSAARAAIPAQLLAQLSLDASPGQRALLPGRTGQRLLRGRRGRPAGVRPGEPRHGSRLNLLATLRTAAPWQRLRRESSGATGAGVRVQRSDFRITWCRPRSQSVTLFSIDASGSSALHRLAESKGAVELLLAECYVRRDQVAVIAFRGRGAEIVLPATRSLVRAKRALAALPGGGGTPLAAGIDAARTLAEQLRRRGLTPLLVLLTDGQANIARDGTPGRPRAFEEALHAARLVRFGALAALLIDTAARPQASARRLAEAMQGRYLPLPHADARSLLGAVQAAAR
jgi:magnesium chelatase subunit D